MQFISMRHYPELLQNLFFLEPLRQPGQRLRIALSGGSTPGLLYQAMATDPGLYPENIEFFQVDERYVSPQDQASNYRMMQENLLAHLPTSCQEFTCFDTSLKIEEALDLYQKKLQKLTHPFFDLVLLGMGSDGHIASLFPYTNTLTEEVDLVAHTTTDQFAIHDRLTLTFPAIFPSKAIVVVVRGQDKREQIQELKDFAEEWRNRSTLTFDSDSLPQFNASLITPEMMRFPAKALVYHPNVTVVYIEE